MPCRFGLHNFLFYLAVSRGWDISVGIATGYWLAGLGSFPGRGKRFFSSL
jgi:hypothetical protein